MQTSLNIEQQRALFKICLLAAFADGDKHQAEREELQALAEKILDDSECPRQLTRHALLRDYKPADLAPALDTPRLRLLAYELALGVCEADGLRSDKETQFLNELRAALQLGSDGEATNALTSADTLASAACDTATLAASALVPPPLPAQPARPDNEKTILSHAIIAAALELLPQNLATLAVIPVQMKLVHTIGVTHGHKLDTGHIKEFAATIGLGLTSQIIEQHARKFLGGLVKKTLKNKFLGGLAGQATSSAFTFAATYGLGKAADAYYGAGRKLELSALKNLFVRATDAGRELHARYRPQIQQQAATLDLGKAIALARGGAIPNLL